MRPEAGHSMMARRSSTPGRAKRTMRRALPDRRRGRPRCTCPTCMRRNRTSRPESRASALYPSRPTCNGRRHCPSRSRREQKRRARTRNEADKEGLGAPSCGRSQTLLYNEDRPHGAIGNKPPGFPHDSRRRIQPAGVTKAGKLYLPAVQRWVADHKKAGTLNPRGGKSQWHVNINQFLESNRHD